MDRNCPHDFLSQFVIKGVISLENEGIFSGGGVGV